MTYIYHWAKAGFSYKGKGILKYIFQNIHRVSYWNNYESHYWTAWYHWIRRRLSKWKISFSLRNIALFDTGSFQGYHRKKPLPVLLSLTLVKVLSFWAVFYVFSAWFQTFKKYGFVYLIYFLSCSIVAIQCYIHFKFTT